MQDSIFFKFLFSNTNQNLDNKFKKKYFCNNLLLNINWVDIRKC